MNPNFNNDPLDLDCEDIEEIKKGKMPLMRLLPNTITIIAICFGITSIKMALMTKWELAVICIIVACFLDGIDGKIARALGVSSEFGAQLDSLADFVNFGICPAIVTYLWNVQYIEIGQLGWAVTLFYCVCCAIRLARFNVSVDEVEKYPWKKMFFIGMSSTMTAMYCMCPIMIYIEFGYKISPLYNAIYLFCLGMIMPSRIPTFSGKKVNLDHKIALIALVALGLIIGILIVKPWVMIPIILLLYFLTIPFSVLVYCKKIKSS